jgi:hypothetical protein
MVARPRTAPSHHNLAEECNRCRSNRRSGVEQGACRALAAGAGWSRAGAIGARGSGWDTNEAAWARGAEATNGEPAEDEREAAAAEDIGDRFALILYSY